eukprot:CAMPEP_0195108906 /NCGR_PEP_ID=MMETSP0448-20130528/87231_1 /TAXON_ID=66468 /ORGANISM="Heterocapsa triquestra, Strain CCMP 448" /LENGTH=87 /DNA_ID=CAMNT_0040145481 /DNA_START=12 /DNA_END=272 /DNA_ORIENTATION=-
MRGALLTPTVATVVVAAAVVDVVAEQTVGPMAMLPAQGTFTPNPQVGHQTSPVTPVDAGQGIALVSVGVELSLHETGVQLCPASTVP